MLLAFALYGSQLVAQSSARQKLVDAVSFLKEGHPAQAIASAQIVIDSNAKPTADLAKAWNILGLAYEEEEKFTAAQHAYEQAILLLKNGDLNVSEYAEVLSNLGDMYRDLGRYDTATILQQKALHLYEGSLDHEGIFRVCSDLAGIEFSLKRTHRGKKYLNRAFGELKNAPSLNDDDRAFGYELRGWSAELESNFSAALSEYRQALEIWQRDYGEHHVNTGWGHVLLGKVYFELGDMVNAEQEFHRGISILGEVLGTQSIRYLSAEIAYSRLLDQIGAHEEATQLRKTAQDDISRQYHARCVDCLISANALH